jgi:hypothetical protein
MSDLTVHQAYASMYAFLEQYYERGRSDDIGALLGFMSLLPDGGTADPAIWHDWLAAVRAAEAGEVDVSLRLM